MNHNQEIAKKLRDMAVNTGTLNCLRCGFEHNCSVHGCAVLKQAAELISQPNEPLTLEHLRASPHGKIKDSTLQSICNRANEIACRPPEGENHHG